MKNKLIFKTITNVRIFWAMTALALLTSIIAITALAQQENKKEGAKLSKKPKNDDDVIAPDFLA